MNLGRRSFLGTLGALVVAQPAKPEPVTFTVGPGTTWAVPSDFNGEITSIEITNGGAGYTSSPIITYSAPGGKLYGSGGGGGTYIKRA